MNIAIIDCGMGNLRSLFKAFYFPASSLHPTVNAKFVRSVQEIRQADTEQGSFLHCIKALNNNGLQKVLQEVFLKRTFLGICVDAQLFFEKNDQENCTDLELYHGIVKALAKQIDDKKIKIPYIGWNTLKQKKAHLLLQGIAQNSYFYFAHSYYLAPEEKITLGESVYAFPFTTFINRNNVIATQFHPEKSRRAGLQFLKNFILWDGTT